jgi:hypothetical protein
MFTHLTLKSRNEKTGPIPVSTTDAASCPPSCPFNNGGGCYAASGPLALHWRKVSDGRAGAAFDKFCEQVAALPAGQLWRHNQAGDLAGVGDEIDLASLAKLIKANAGKRGFTYTHKPMTPQNAAAVATANDNGFCVNVSANNLQHADALSQANVGPVVSVLPIEYERKNKRGQWLETEKEYKARLRELPQTTPAGRKLTVCPATYKDGVSCASCKLCAVIKRETVVGFPAHGVQKKRASAVAGG